MVYWFQPGYPAFVGDMRLPIVPQAYATHSLFVTNEIDFGLPSAYFPRLVDPFFVMMVTFESLGASIFLSQMLATYAVYLMVSILVFFYVKNIVRGEIVTAFVASLFFTSNLYLLADTGTSALSYMAIALTIFPSLTAFSEALKRRSPLLMSLAGFLIVLTYATFPNYRALVTCGILLLITLIALEGKRLLTKEMLRYYAIFLISASVASIWMISFVAANLNSVGLSNNQPTSPIPFLSYVNQFDVPRLITKWTFYDNTLNMNYVPYANMYLQNIPLIIISYIPAVFAFSSLLVTKFRRRTIFFAALAVIFLFLTMGFTIYLNGLYTYLVDNVPLMKAFREQASWTFFVALLYGILIGMFTTAVVKFLKRSFLKILAVCGIVAVIFAAAYPLFTGEVTNNWLYPKTKGSYIPQYFSQAQQAMPSDGWTLLLPQRNMYVAYNFSEKGMLNAGNPYPYLYSKPLLYGTGTEYFKSTSVDVIYFAYSLVANGNQSVDKFLGLLGIRSLLVEKNIVLGNTSNAENPQGFNLVQEWDYASLYKLWREFPGDQFYPDRAFGAGFGKGEGRCQRECVGPPETCFMVLPARWFCWLWCWVTGTSGGRRLWKRIRITHDWFWLDRPSRGGPSWTGRAIPWLKAWRKEGDTAACTWRRPH